MIYSIDMTPSDKVVNKWHRLNVQGQMKLMVLSDKFTRNKLCVDLIDHYNIEQRSA